MRSALNRRYNNELSNIKLENENMTAPATAKTNTATWTVDASHAEVGFSVRHLMISTVRGRFGGVSGTVILDDRKPSASKADVTIDVSTIDTRQEQRDAHRQHARRRRHYVGVQADWQPDDPRRHARDHAGRHGRGPWARSVGQRSGGLQ